MENTATAGASKQLPGATSARLSGIKPKLEPCDDEFLRPPVAVSDSVEGWEAITPLGAGNPFFSIVLSRNHVHKKFLMLIPPRFYHLLPEARTAAVLRCGGSSWPMSYCGDLKQKKFDAAWKAFAVDNKLEIGDACVFELTGSGGEQEEEETVVCFQVQILRGGLPRGKTPDVPIVIDD
ncbi:hypothetical protein ABZP36_010332 [Zizania latifolia]